MGGDRDGVNGRPHPAKKPPGQGVGIKVQRTAHTDHVGHVLLHPNKNDRFPPGVRTLAGWVDVPAGDGAGGEHVYLLSERLVSRSLVPSGRAFFPHVERWNFTSFYFRKRF